MHTAGFWLKLNIIVENMNSELDVLNGTYTFAAPVLSMIAWFNVSTCSKIMHPHFTTTLSDVQVIALVMCRAMHAFSVPPQHKGKCRASAFMQIYPQWIYHCKELGNDNQMVPAV